MASIMLNYQKLVCVTFASLIMPEFFPSDMPALLRPVGGHPDGLVRLIGQAAYAATGIVELTLHGANKPRVELDDRTRYSLHDYAFGNPGSWGHGQRYGDLWNKYLAAVPLLPNSNLGARMAHLRGWSQWTMGQHHNLPLTPLDVQLVGGPARFAATYSRAELSGLKLRRKSLDSTSSRSGAGTPKASTDSLFAAIVAHEDGTTRWEVGQAEQFLLVQMPGESAQTAPKQFVDVRWCVRAHNAAGLARTPQSGFPIVVMGKFQRDSHVVDNFITSLWPLQMVAPVPVAIAPLDEMHPVPDNLRFKGVSGQERRCDNVKLGAVLLEYFSQYKNFD